MGSKARCVEHQQGQQPTDLGLATGQQPRVFCHLPALETKPNSCSQTAQMCWAEVSTSQPVGASLLPGHHVPLHGRGAAGRRPCQPCVARVTQPPPHLLGAVGSCCHCCVCRAESKSRASRLWAGRVGVAIGQAVSSPSSPRSFLWPPELGAAKSSWCFGGGG